MIPIVATGNIVHLLDRELPVCDRLGVPIEYQVVAIYNKRHSAALVSSYGEYVGVHHLGNIRYVSDGPLFKREDYSVGSNVIWLDGEDVYEGVIKTLHQSSAQIVNVKRLYPINHEVRVPYWKISENSKADTSETVTSVAESISTKERLNMSTRANIILRNETTIRREIVLYQHADAHPNNMTLLLAEMLRDTYLEFKELGDMDWFLNPSKLASFLVVKSVPSPSDEIRAFLKKLPDAMRHHFESTYHLGMPNLLVENGRVSNCNYDYIITLSEDVEDGFFGYELEVNKMNNNKLVNTILKHKENLLREKPVSTKKKQDTVTNSK